MPVTDFDSLDEIRPQTAAVYAKYFEKSKTETADACFNSRLAWNYGHEYRYAELAGCFVPISLGGRFNLPNIALPIGEIKTEGLKLIADELGPLIKGLCGRKGDRGGPCSPDEIRFLYVDEGYLQCFKDIEGYSVRYGCNIDYSDYVYDAAEIRELKGNNYRQKRNRVNRFIRDYPEFWYKSIEKSDKDKVLKLCAKWTDDKESDLFDPWHSDYIPISRLFDYMDDLEVHGGAVLFGDELIAFSIGSLPSKDRAVLHFEKADPDYEGLYAFINQIVLIKEFPDILTVNREEDMGLENIRIAKESYNPIKMVDKYEVYLKKEDV